MAVGPKRLPFVVLVGLLAAACGSTAPSPSAVPTLAPVASVAVESSPSVAPPPSVVPPVTASPSPPASASTSPEPSASRSLEPTAAPTAPPPSPSATNDHAAPDLEKLLPDTFRDITLTKQSFDGRILGTDPASVQLKGFLASHSKNLADFAEAGASDPTPAHQVTFVVFRVPGIDATVLTQAIVAATVAATPDLKVSTGTVGSRTVIRADEPASVRYLFASQGLVFGVQASTEDIANEAIALIP